MRGGAALGFLSGLILLIVPVPILQWFARSLLVLLALSWLYSYFQRRYVWIERDRDEIPMYRHSSAQVSLILTNYLPVPVSSILLSDEPGGLISDNNERAILTLSPGQRGRMGYQVKAHERGRYRLGPVTVQSSDPLGFFPWEKRMDLAGSVIVFPRVYPLSLILDQGSPTGPISTNNPIYEDPSRLRSFHEYQPGDDPRRIQWKVSAKTGTIHVSEYLASLSVPGLVLLNLNSEDYSGKRDFYHSERAIEVAASAIQFWSDLGEEFALVANGIPMATGSIGPAAGSSVGGSGSANAVAASAAASAGGQTAVLATTSSALSPEDGKGGEVREEENKQAADTRPMLTGPVLPDLPDETFLQLFPFAKGKAHASLILRNLATIKRSHHGEPERSAALFEAVYRLRPSPGTRIIYVGPSLHREDFSRHIAGFSPSWSLDLWFLDERVYRENHLQPGSQIPGRRSRILRIREFGEDLFDV